MPPSRPEITRQEFAEAIRSGTTEQQMQRLRALIQSPAGQRVERQEQMQRTQQVLGLMRGMDLLTEQHDAITRITQEMLNEIIPAQFAIRSFDEGPRVPSVPGWSNIALQTTLASRRLFERPRSPEALGIANQAVQAELDFLRGAPAINNNERDQRIAYLSIVSSQMNDAHADATAAPIVPQQGDDVWQRRTQLTRGVFLRGAQTIDVEKARTEVNTVRTARLVELQEQGLEAFREAIRSFRDELHSVTDERQSRRTFRERSLPRLQELFEIQDLLYTRLVPSIDREWIISKNACQNACLIFYREPTESSRDAALQALELQRKVWSASGVSDSRDASVLSGMTGDVRSIIDSLSGNIPLFFERHRTLARTVALPQAPAAAPAPASAPSATPPITLPEGPGNTPNAGPANTPRERVMDGLRNIPEAATMTVRELWNSGTLAQTGIIAGGVLLTQAVIRSVMAFFRMFRRPPTPEQAAAAAQTRPGFFRRWLLYPLVAGGAWLGWSWLSRMGGGGGGGNGLRLGPSGTPSTAPAAVPTDTPPQVREASPERLERRFAIRLANANDMTPEDLQRLRYYVIDGEASREHIDAQAVLNRLNRLRGPNIDVYAEIHVEDGSIGRIGSRAEERLGKVLSDNGIAHRVRVNSPRNGEVWDKRTVRARVLPLPANTDIEAARVFRLPTSGQPLTIFEMVQHLARMRMDNSVRPVLQLVRNQNSASENSDVVAQLRQRLTRIGITCNVGTE